MTFKGMTNIVLGRRQEFPPADAGPPIRDQENQPRGSKDNGVFRRLARGLYHTDTYCP